MNKLILVIEDDPFVRRYYGRLFGLNNYQVELAADGNEGIAKAEKFKPGLILLDVMMAPMNGIDVLEKLKTNPKTRDISVVVMTNYDEEDMNSKTIQMGAREYLLKSSVSSDDLLAIAKKYL